MTQLDRIETMLQQLLNILDPKKVQSAAPAAAPGSFMARLNAAKSELAKKEAREATK